jgi:peptidoglycan hydrolase-like protein with peptidoglycan-binding domain
MTARLVFLFTLLQLAVHGLQVVHAQSLICQDGTGRQIAISGSTACPFGLIPFQANTGAPKQAQIPTANTPSRPTPPSFEDTVAIQSALKASGFYNGAVDGLAGPGTEAAVSAWQRINKLPSTGYLTETQVTALKRQAAISVTTPATAPPSIPTPPSTQASPEKALPRPSVTQPSQVISPNNSTSSLPSPPQSALVKKYSPTLGIKNAEDILSGNNRDLVFFFNETDTAPNGVRGLSGNVAFVKDTVNLCLFPGVTSNETFMDWVKIDWVRKEKTVQNFELRLKECPAFNNVNGPLAAFDLFGVERRLLTNSANVETPLLLTLLQLTQAKKITYYTTSEYVPFEVYEESRRAEAAKNLRLLKEGKMAGFGAILVNPNVSLVCSPTTEEPTLLSVIAGQTIESFTEPKIRAKRDFQVRQEAPEGVFLSAKRKVCGFLVGDADFLKTLVLALERDGVTVKMAPLWLKQEKVDTLLKDLDTKKQLAKAREQEENRLAKIRQQEEDAQRAQALLQARQAEEAAKIEQERRQKLLAAKQDLENLEKQEELKRLRKLVESRGQSIVDDWNKKLRAQVASISKEIQDIKDPVAQKKLAEQDPVIATAQRKKERLDGNWVPFTNWQIAMAKEGWEFGDTKSTLEDYGLARWRSRMIETVAIKVEFAVINRVIGERRTACWNFIWINDEEFNFQRQPLAVQCGKYASEFKDWSIANQFKSQWKM